MNAKFWITGVVLFVLTMAIGFLVHATLLHPDYTALAGIMRGDADAMAHFPYLLLAHVFFSFGVAWIYQQGVKPGASWLGQGIRFGIALAMISSVYMYLVYYAVEPMPPMLVVKQIIFDSIGCIIVGIVAAFINKPAAAATE
jgi:hypothetical protein